MFLEYTRRLEDQKSYSDHTETYFIASSYHSYFKKISKYIGIVHLFYVESNAAIYFNLPTETKTSEAFLFDFDSAMIWITTIILLC